jgi:16S rRNA (adenine1518-N6/adenine1519-N6)-dimethyltransferase
VKIYIKKSLGQHFLHDNSVILKIIAAIAPNQNEHLVEIGPGLGALTSELLTKTQRLDAVEFDRDLVLELQTRFANTKPLTIYQADALKFDFCTLKNDEKPLRIVGNLPYNISTPIIFHLLKSIDCIADMHFMLQKEVVDRLAAKHGNKTYGRLSVMVQYFCEVESLFSVPPQAFIPIPKVYSSFVRLIPRKKKPLSVTNLANLEQLVKQAFNHRRKTIQNCLKGLITAEQLTNLGFDLKLRPEQLSVDDFVKLSNTLDSSFHGNDKEKA